MDSETVSTINVDKLFKMYVCSRIVVFNGLCHCTAILLTQFCLGFKVLLDDKVLTRVSCVLHNDIV